MFTIVWGRGWSQTNGDVAGHEDRYCGDGWGWGQITVPVQHSTQ